MPSISKDQAVEYCDQLRTINQRRWFTYQAWWCWGCTTFTKGDPDKRCFASTVDNRGCGQLNEYIDKQNKR